MHQAYGDKYEMRTMEWSDGFCEGQRFGANCS